MTQIDVKLKYYTMQKMYERATTKKQRALLGYMIKTGYANEPVFKSAFRLLCKIEKCKGVYILVRSIDTRTYDAIINIVDAAMHGQYDAFALTERDIGKILQQINTFNRR